MKRLTLAAGFSLTLLLELSAIAPAMARPVFNQPRSTIEQYFGQPWTKLTMRIDGDKPRTIVRYTYSPTRLRQKFPEFPRATLAVDYHDDRATTVILIPNLEPSDAINSDTIVIEKKIEARFFKFLLDYNSGLYKPLRFVGGNAGQDYSNCLGDGVVSNYGFDTLNQPAKLTNFGLAYTRSCSRPYDQIKFTQEFLGG